MPRSPASIAASLRLQAKRERDNDAHRRWSADHAVLSVRAENTVANMAVVGIEATLALADRLAAGDAETLAAWVRARGTDQALAEVIAWAADHRLMAE